MTTLKESKITLFDKSIYIKMWIPENLNSTVPIILIHDSLGSVDLWKDFPLKLSQVTARQVIAYDRLGFGKSDPCVEKPTENFIIEEAEVFFPVLKKQLLIQNYVLLGHSVGGGMAINIAAKDHECLGVISISAQAFIEKITLSGITKAKEFFMSDNQIKRLEKWHGSKAKRVLNAWVDIWLSPEFSQWSLRYCIQDVNCPTLIIHGDKDEYGTTAFPHFIAEHVGGYSDMLILNDCGHVPHKENTNEVLKAISRFLLLENV
ncbi:alpha/beta hydrolase [Colwellia sp. MSW7]|jgi:pimeloyl-ACP methyl ester carboxylesterase|uniref:Alpha/beta hydrolase n=1 Tax=Colwellia maritima TaxID=2912588 RepID=A0ABS9X621_9GAMM|nr:alpha/beta hydrolase [Colwellia maritima]MCI2285681.1 alpha/beta hydrolase [Colwellia maritima]